MRKWIILSVVFLSLIIPGCRTIEYVYPEYVLPAEPVRVDQPSPITKKDYALIYNYYEHLVREWEKWAVSVYAIIQESK